MSNFDFLNTYWPDFAKIMEFAENYVYTDPASSKNKSGLFLELMVREILRVENIPEPEDKKENTHYNRIKLLKDDGILPYDVNQWINQVRLKRNDSSHENLGSSSDALLVLKFAFRTAVWFMQVYGDGSFKANQFVDPEKTKVVPDYTKLVLNQERKIEEQNEEIAKYEATLSEHNKLLAEQQALIEQLTKEREGNRRTTPQAALTKQERQNISAIAISNTKLSEDETRKLIDEQLRRVGWEVDTHTLRYSKGTRPQKGKKVAIAEWPVNSPTSKDHRADYALFIDEKLIGIIEAKAYEKSVYSIIDNQCNEYARNIKDEDEKYLLGKWGKYQVPFIFATNGRPYLKQIETESGIWFQDLRKETNNPIALQGWYSPDELMAKFKQNVDEADQKLSNLPYDFLRDPDGLNFRHYQLSAVEAVENAVINGKNRILLAMATGTGKTRTILGMIYRFLKTNRFRRILFLVDRTALGEQAQEVFKDVKLEDLQPLNKIYNINTLDDIELASETRIQVATVQGMVARIMSDDKERIPSSGDFDCIIIDEAHRGYSLDKELSEAELLYRDQNDFVSKYTKVIEYFDAVRIGLTATPAIHTTKIFGEAVFTYSYREAVIDGYLVDYDAPHIIKTELNQNGIHHKKGETLARYNPITKELLNPAELEDEVDFEVEVFNKNVITDSFNDVVLQELSKYIDPEGEEKTIIFARSKYGEIGNRYLLNYLNIFNYSGYVNGTTRLKLTQGEMLKIPFPLPPTLAEQQRIVNRIESMFAKLDEAKEKAQNVVDGFETRKAAILHKAFTGELTAKWRKENGVSDDSWVVKTIGETMQLQAGKNISADKISLVQDNINKYPCFGGNGIRGYVDSYNKDGHFPIIGRQGALCGNLKYATGQFYATEHAVVVSCPSNIDSIWAYYTLGTMNLNQYATATAQPGLAVSNIVKLNIFVPSLHEQQEIVRILDSVLEKESRAKDAAQTVLDQVALLKKSILARAFRGEL